MVRSMVAHYEVCQQVNQQGKTPDYIETCSRGINPRELWEIDFTKVKPGLNGYKYFLVFVETFSGSVGAFPTKHVTAQ